YLSVFLLLPEPSDLYTLSLHDALPILINAIDRLFREDRAGNSVKVMGRGQVATEGLLQDYAAVRGEPRCVQALDDCCEQRRRNRQIVHGQLYTSQVRFEANKDVGVVVVTGHVAKALVQCA